MSYAWNKLRLAAYCLTEAGSQRERLTAAVAKHLASLRPKDLPSTLRHEFTAVSDRLCLGRTLEQHASVKQRLEALDDEEVGAMIGTILHIYDAVTRYQPIQTAEDDKGTGCRANLIR